MDINEVKSVLCGPVIPLVTHYHADGSIHLDATAEEARHLAERGIVHGRGVFLGVGAGGDFPLLSVEDRKAVAKAIVDAAHGRTPVLVGAQDTNVYASIEIAQWAESIGAFGIQLSAPYYYGCNDEDCLRFFTAVHDATERIAIMIYNSWWHGYDLSIEQLDRLADLERCVGLKWSKPEGGTAYEEGVAKLADRFAIIDNQGRRVACHMLGGTGFVTHLASVWPEFELEVYQLLKSRAFDAAQEKMMEACWPWWEFRKKMSARTGSESPVVAAALELCGRHGGPTRLPNRGLYEEEREELRELLERIGVPGVRVTVP